MHFPVSYGLSIFHVYGPAGVPLLRSVCSDVLPILLLDNLLNTRDLFFMCVCVCIYPPICALPFHLHNNVFNVQVTLEQHRFDCASPYTDGLSSTENTIVLHHLWTGEPEDVEPQTRRNHIYEDVQP